MPDETSNHGLHQYDQGELNWTHSQDMAHIEDLLPLYDIESNRSNYEPHDGATFRSSDSNTVYDGTGTQWSKAVRDYAEIGADRLGRSLDADGNDITGIGTLEFDTLDGDLTFDGNNLTGVDQLGFNRLASGMNAAGFDITNVSTLSADRLGSNIYADDNDITGVNNLDAFSIEVNSLDAGGLLSNLDGGGNDISNVGTLTATSVDAHLTGTADVATLWDDYELVFDDETPTESTYIRMTHES